MVVVGVLFWVVGLVGESLLHREASTALTPPSTPRASRRLNRFNLMDIVAALQKGRFALGRRAESKVGARPARRLTCGSGHCCGLAATLLHLGEARPPWSLSTAPLARCADACPFTGLDTAARTASRPTRRHSWATTVPHTCPSFFNSNSYVSGMLIVAGLPLAYDVGASPVISRIISIQSSSVRSSRPGRPSVGRSSSW